MIRSAFRRASTRFFSVQRKLRPDETPHPRMYVDDHPAFPTRKELRHKERLAYGLSAVITATTFFAAYYYAQPIQAETANEPEEEKSLATTVPIEQMETVKKSRANPGVYAWGSNKNQLISLDSNQSAVMSPAVIEVRLSSKLKLMSSSLEGKR